MSHHDYEPFTAYVLRIDGNSLEHDSKIQQLLLYHSYFSVDVKRHSVWLKVIKMARRWSEKMDRNIDENLERDKNVKSVGQQI